MPAIVLESDRPEWAYLRGEKLGSVAYVLAATAGQRNVVRLRNPAGSGVIATLTHHKIGASATKQLFLRIGTSNTTLGTAIATQLRDLRAGGTFTSAIIVSSDQTGAAFSGVRFDAIQVPGGTSLPYDIEVVLTPGTSLDIEDNNVNTDLAGSFWWRERALEASEL